MNPWSNIQLADTDPEIDRINAMEKRLGELPDNVYRVRELITRFEVCHFKYQQHIKKIMASIHDLEPGVDPAIIGNHHIRQGVTIPEKDINGKSELGIQYVRALRDWLEEDQEDTKGDNTEPLRYRVRKWLGVRSPEKMRLVRLLLARLIWDWNSYEQLLQGGPNEVLEQQVIRMDICHYAFPKNLDLLIQGIGQMKPVEREKFEGCGSFNAPVKAWLEKELLALNSTLGSSKENDPDKDNRIRIWLLACMAKTIKENIHSPELLSI